MSNDDASQLGEATVNFESGVARLEEIIHALEQKELPLDQALELFRTGVGLVQHCNVLLDRAEQQMEILMENEDGSLRVEPAHLTLER